MSRPRLQYSTVDWLRLRPILPFYKLARRRAIGHLYVRKKAPDPQALSDIVQRYGTRPLVITTVYNSAWITKWQLKLGELAFSGIDRLIADNSSDPAAARKIEALCREASIPYLRLPFNRFSLGRPKDASLSHSCALNWVWRNVVVRIRPRPPLVAFIDQDLVPLRPVDFSAKIADQPFFGVKRDGVWDGWTIWPGCAVFSGSLIDRYEFDFWVDEQAGLDTGGANWQRVFRHFDSRPLRHADAPLSLIGRFEEWWHIGGISGYYAKPEGWIADTEAALKREYDALAAHQTAKAN